MPEAIVGLIPTNPLGSMVQSDMLAVVIFAIVLGVAVVSLERSEAKPVLSLLGSVRGGGILSASPSPCYARGPGRKAPVGRNASMQSRAVAQLASLTFALSVLGFLVLRASGCMSSPPTPATAESPQSAPAASVVAAPTTSAEAAPTTSAEATPEAAPPGPAPSGTALAPSATAASPTANAPAPTGPKPRFMPATKAGPIFDPQPQAPAPQQQQLNPP